MPNKDFLVICHNIRSLYNVGSIFRTADGFGVTKIFLTGYTGTPRHPRLKKTALGAEQTVPWEYHRQLKRLLLNLKQKKTYVVALENQVPHTLPLKKFRPKYPLALVLGEEKRGIAQSFLKICDKIIEIPLFGQKESLNVSVAFGIAAYHISNYQSAKRKNHPPQVSSTGGQARTERMET